MQFPSLSRPQIYKPSVFGWGGVRVGGCWSTGYLTPRPGESWTGEILYHNSPSLLPRHTHHLSGVESLKVWVKLPFLPGDQIWKLLGGGAGMGREKANSPKHSSDLKRFLLSELPITPAINFPLRPPPYGN